MQNEKEEIKSWLKQTGRNRDWLASKCFVSKMAIDQWFKKVGIIPSAKLALIKSLMETSVSPVEKKELLSLPNPEGLDRITIEVDGELQININKKALALGMTTSCWASLALEEAAGEPDIMERIERLYAKKNAAFSSREVPEETPPLFCFTKKKAARYIDVVGKGDR